MGPVIAVCLVAAMVFAAATAYDWANSHYIKANSDDSYLAMLWSAIVGGCAVVGLLGMLSVSNWMAIPEIAGFSTGTGIAVWQRRRKRKCSSSS